MLERAGRKVNVHGSPEANQRDAGTAGLLRSTTYPKSELPAWFKCRVQFRQLPVEGHKPGLTCDVTVPSSWMTMSGRKWVSDRCLIIVNARKKTDVHNLEENMKTAGQTCPMLLNHLSKRKKEKNKLIPPICVCFLVFMRTKLSFRIHESLNRIMLFLQPVTKTQ